MSTTVVASRHRASLAVFPVAGPPLDVDALRQVLGRHGLELLGDSDLLTAHEFITAEGLDPTEAVALAEDLRGIGLHARVVNRTSLTTSRRVANAMGAQMVLSFAGFLATITASTGVQDAIGRGDPVGAIPVVVGVLAVLTLGLAGINGLTLARQGGSALRVAGVARGSSPTRQLTDQLSHLEQVLPGHLAAPMLARARQLERQALAHPDGEAARELATLIDELRSDADEQAAKELRELREELARARRAAKELA